MNLFLRFRVLDTPFSKRSTVIQNHLTTNACTGFIRVCVALSFNRSSNGEAQLAAVVLRKRFRTARTISSIVDVIQSRTDCRHVFNPCPISYFYLRFRAYYSFSNAGACLQLLFIIFPVSLLLECLSINFCYLPS